MLNQTALLKSKWDSRRQDRWGLYQLYNPDLMLFLSWTPLCLTSHSIVVRCQASLNVVIRLWQVPICGWPRYAVEHLNMLFDFIPHLLYSLSTQIAKIQIGTSHKMRLRRNKARYGADTQCSCTFQLLPKCRHKLFKAYLDIRSNIHLNNSWSLRHQVTLQVSGMNRNL